MNKKLIHLKNDLESLNKSYLLCLGLVFLFGIYKNIISLLASNINNTLLLSRLLFIVIGFSAGLLNDFIKNQKLSMGFNTIGGLIVGMIIPFKTNLIIFIISMLSFIGIDFIDKDNKINKICLIKILCVILMVVFSNYTYLNPMETSYEYAYSLWDVFVGNQIGGIFSTSAMLVLISLMILSANKLYKSKIVLISLGSYILTLCCLLISKNYMSIFLMMLNSSNIFAFVFIAPFSIYSPYKNKETIVYSLIVGIITALITYFVNFYEAAIISILFANLVIILWNRIHKSTNNS